MVSIVNLKLKLEYQTKNQKKVNVTLNLDKINLSILKPQLKNMLKSYENFNLFRKVQNDL